jgi:Rieske Fe-S protein
MDDGKKQGDGGRRGFLTLLGGLGLAWAGASLYPACKYLSPQATADPFAKGKVPVEKVTLADVATPGAGKNGGYAGRGLILFRDASGSLRAFDSKCTHAGCNVQFEGARLHCNCHGGVYDLDGKNVSGPPPRPLTPLRVIEENGHLYVERIEGKG